MIEGFRVEKKGEKTVAKFQGVEMVPGSPITTDVPSAIKEIRDSNILDTGLKGENGFDEFQAFIIPKNGVWPDLKELPEIVQKTFRTALEVERSRNPELEKLTCHISVRLQGDKAAESSRRFKEKAEAEGKKVEDQNLHFDGQPDFGPISEYLISFTTPTTIQYLGEKDLPEDATTATLHTNDLRAPAAELNPVSWLPGHLYHMTEHAPHSEPLNMSEFVSDEKPRLFMRFMFADIKKGMVTGRVIQAK